MKKVTKSLLLMSWTLNFMNEYHKVLMIKVLAFDVSICFWKASLILNFFLQVDGNGNNKRKVYNAYTVYCWAINVFQNVGAPSQLFKVKQRRTQSINFMLMLWKKYEYKIKWLSISFFILNGEFFQIPCPHYIFASFLV